MGPYDILLDLGTFSAAHMLPNHMGKCHNLHGHNYRVEVGLSWGSLNKAGSQQGMLIDFGYIKELWKAGPFSQVDHAFLVGTEPIPWLDTLVSGYQFQTEIPYLDGEDTRDILQQLLGKVAFLDIPVTTAECLAELFFRQMEGYLESTSFPERMGYFVGNSRMLQFVRVWETPTSCGIYNR